MKKLIALIVLLPALVLAQPNQGGGPFGISPVNVIATNGIVNMNGSGLGARDNTKGTNGNLGLSLQTDANLWAFGTSGWDTSIDILAGMANIGHQYSMSSNAAPSLNIYKNGNPQNARYQNATNQTRMGTGVFLHNLNPFTDGVGFYVPHYTTNSVGSAVLTNADGVKIYVKNQFGNQFITIPEEYYIGETNQAGSYCWLFQPDLPAYISCNMQLPGESGDFYSQHFFAGFDVRGVSSATDNRNFGTHFPMQVPYCWTFTNMNNIDALYIDERYGQVYVYSNFFLGGSLRATNMTGGIQHVIGQDFRDTTRRQIGLFITTNTAFGSAGDPTIVTFDATSGGTAFGRLGFVKQNGQYPKMAAASGAPFVVAKSDQGNLNDSNGGSLVPAMQISSTDQSLTESSATTVINITLASGKSLSARVFATTRADDATNFQEDGDSFLVAAVNKGGTVTASISAVVNTSAVSSGTLTTTWTVAANGNGVDIKCNAVSSLTQTTLKTKFRMDLDSTDGGSTITPVN